LAERLGTQLTLVNVSAPLAFLPPPGRVPPMTPRAEKALHDERNQQAQALVEAVAREAGVTEADRTITPGDAADRLIQEARDRDADLIVVGSRGHGAMKSALLGSVSAAVVRHAHCPVVIVPAAVVEEAFAS
jgi:nucleotide-binding universal stress UspA family protein